VSWSLPVADLQLSEADVAAVLEVYASGWLTMGPLTQSFERALAEMHGVPHGVAVSSGTAALHLAMVAAGIGPGDEVLVPAMTFVAGAAAVRYCGARPVFVESLGTADLGLDPDDARRRIGPRTKAILGTHWMGYACDLPALERLCAEFGLILLEDCAQSITARDSTGRLTGTVGTASCFSFFSKKQLSCGEGGMILTADDELAAKARSLRSHAMSSMTWDRHRGHAESYDITDIGFNFRIDEPRAALALSRLPRLATDIAQRRHLVRRYRDQLSGVPGVGLPWAEEDPAQSAHFGFVIMLDTAEERYRVAEELSARGIQTTCYPSLPTLTAYRDHPSLPRTADLAARHLLLPLASTYSEPDVDLVATELTEIVAARAGGVG
jgi:dTDP-4-amino-4,6-dideoxygalactose transaminase